MVAYQSSSHLLLFGGYGTPSGPIQPGAEFIDNSDGQRSTNEIHTFDLKEGEDANHYAWVYSLAEVN